MYVSKKQCFTDDDYGRRDERSDEQAEDEYSDDDPKPLDQVHVRYLDGLGATDAEDHGNPAK